MGRLLTLLGAALGAAALAAAAAPSAQAQAVFGEAATFGQTPAEVGHLNFADDGARGVVAVSAGRSLLLAPVTARGFGRLRTARLRGDDIDLGPIVASDRRGRVLIIERVGDRVAAVWFSPSGRRLRTQRLARSSTGHALVANERGDAWTTLTLPSGARRDLFARAGGRFRRVPSPPRGVEPAPNLQLDPAGRAVATYARGGTLQVARRGTRGRWSRARTVFSGSVGNRPVDFAPNGDALLAFTTDRALHVAWARRGRPFGSPRTVAPLEDVGIPNIELTAGGRATIAWTDPETTIHIRKARFGRSFAAGWDSPRGARISYLEAVPGTATWQEVPDRGLPQTIRAAALGGSPREQILETAPAGTRLYSPRLSLIRGRPLVAWARIERDEGRTLRGAIARR